MVNLDQHQLDVLNEIDRDMKDLINSPSHYNSGKFETIEVIEDLGLERGFCLGNAIKYISRAGRKKGSSELDDLKKARWYLDRFIRRLEGQQ